MKLLVVRHGRAGTAEKFAAQGHADDRLRPLTTKGRKRMKRAARGLAVAWPRLDVLGTSPLVRARETAEIVVGAYGSSASPVEVTALAPGASRDELLAWLRERGQLAADATIGLVGHEPDLSRFVGWLLAGDGGAGVELKKGAACLLDLPEPAAGRGTLLWLLAPRHLRRLAK